MANHMPALGGDRAVTAGSYRVQQASKEQLSFSRFSRSNVVISRVCQKEDICQIAPFDLGPTACMLTKDLFENLSLSYLSRSMVGRWGTTVNFITSFLHSSRFSAFRSMTFHSRPVHSLMLSSHRFLCLPLRLPP